MPTIAVERQWTSAAEGRQCGSCYACCVYLGIEELRKHSAQVCKHLCAQDDPTKRCGIYASRPRACADYTCLWRDGYGPDWLQPYNSGILLTPYPPTMGGSFAITMIVFDPSRAKPLLTKVITEVLQLDPNLELRVINFVDKTAMLFHHGQVFDAKLLPSEGYESLNFSAELDKPIGRYALATIPEETPT